jgi:hypothetical protein
MHSLLIVNADGSFNYYLALEGYHFPEGTECFGAETRRS